MRYSRGESHREETNKHAVSEIANRRVDFTQRADCRACGGFCNNNQPITQAAERIFFGLDEGRIHMHVRIQYDGPPDQFGWLLPVPADPTLEVKLSTEALFDSLDQLYAPIYCSTKL